MIDRIKLFVISVMLLLVFITTYQNNKIKKLKVEINTLNIVNNQLLINQKKIESINDNNYKTSIKAINDKQNIEDKYNDLQKELLSVKDNLNKSNVIRNNFLRYINATTSPMPKIPESSSGINDTSTSYTATEVAQFLNDRQYVCDINSARLGILQNNIKQNIETFNGDK